MSTKNGAYLGSANFVMMLSVPLFFAGAARSAGFAPPAEPLVPGAPQAATRTMAAVAASMALMRVVRFMVSSNRGERLRSARGAGRGERGAVAEGTEAGAVARGVRRGGREEGPHVLSLGQADEEPRDERVPRAEGVHDLAGRRRPVGQGLLEDHRATCPQGHDGGL